MNQLSIDHYQSSIKNQKGSALIITLLIVSLLVGLVVNFIHDTYIDSASLSNWTNAQKASLIAKSGQTISADYLKRLTGSPTTTMRETVIPVFIDFGPGTNLIIKVEDESSKFYLNSLINQRGKADENRVKLLQNMFEYLKINPDVALAIVDWIDTDLEPRLPNSENTSKNSALWSLDELKLVDGIDEETFNKISPYLKVHGNNIININSAELPVLISSHINMTEDLANKIIEHRNTLPFETVASVQNRSGLESIAIQLIGSISVRGTNFRITAIATINEITRIIEAVMDTSMNIYFWREA